MQCQIGEDFGIFVRFSLPDDGGPIPRGSIEMSVEAVIAHVGGAAFEPFMKYLAVLNIEVIVHYFFGFFEPDQL